ncbi:MAG: tetratricopeptide repeat protein, partial [bacterium]
MPKCILLSLFIVLPLFLSSQTRTKSITIDGGITTLNNEPIESVKIDVYKDIQLVKSYETNSSGKYQITLDNGIAYVLRYSKPGFVSKKFDFSTEAVNDDDLNYGLFPLVLDLSLFEYIRGLDISEMANPVAKFSYSDYEGDFVYDKDYSEKMSKKVEKIAANSRKLRKEAYDKYISQGDFLYSEDWPEDACTEYMNALSLFPDESYPKSQLNKIRNQLQKEPQLEKTYSTHISRGDKNFGKQNYKVSKSYYQKSLIYKPDEAYPKNRISDIEKILADNPELYDKPEKDAVEYVVLADNTNNQSNNNTATNQNNSSNNQSQNNNQTQNNQNQTTSNNITDKTYSKSSGISDISSKSTPVDEKITDENKSAYLNDLLGKYKSSGDSTNVARVHIALGIEAYNDQSYDLAIEHFRESYELFENAGMTSDQAAVAESMADIYFSMYRYSTSADWYTRANTLYKNAGNDEKASGTLLKSADASYSAGDMEQALSKYMLFADGSDKNKDLSSVYNSIGVIHFEIGNFDEALKYFDMSISNAETKGNIKEVALSLNNIGNIKYEDEDFNSALQYYNRSVMAKNRIDYKAGIAVSLFNIANVYKKTGDYNKALEDYFKAEK